MLRCKLLLFSFFGLLHSNMLTAQVKPGDMSPTARILDAEKIGPFSAGVAVISKGKATALIDVNGNIIVPYDTWYFTNMAVSGMFLVNPVNGRHGYTLINTEGRMLIAPQSTDNNKASLSLSQDGYARVNDGTQIFHINFKGEKFPFDPGPPSRTVLPLREDMGLFAELIDGKSKYGLVDRSGKVVVQAKYDYASDFSDGLALVGKQDGIMRYGFIDKKGKLVIPLRYLRDRPQSFSNGLAGVYPDLQNAGKFCYAYIDKAGNTIFKIDTGFQGEKLQLSLQGSSAPAFANGYVTWRGKEPVIYDTTGRMISVPEFLKKIGVNPADLGVPFSLGGGRGGLVLLRGKDMKVGMYNFDTRKLWPMIFEHFDWNAYDSVSKLTHARIQFMEKGKRKLREGYVNEDGVFVLLILDKTIQ
ncbi:MAG: WG repeat-containing protein [Chitinophagaceae bacterium]